MAQKVNPIAVRLRFNRFSDSIWFSDFYYSTLLYQDLNFRDYLNSIKQPNAASAGLRPASSVIHHYPKKSIIHLFCLSSCKADRRASSRTPRILQVRARCARPKDAPSGRTGGLRPLLNASLKVRNKTPAFGHQENSGGNIGCLQAVYPASRSLATSKLNVGFWAFRQSILQKKKALARFARSTADNLTRLCLNELGSQQFNINKMLGLASKLASDLRRPLAIAKARRLARGAINQLLTQSGWTMSACLDLDKARPPQGRLVLGREVVDACLAGLSVYEHNPFNGGLASNLPSKKLVGAPPSLERPEMSGRDFNNRASDGRLGDPGAGELFLAASRIFFNYYAMHYYFIHKTNSVYKKQCFAMTKQARFAATPALGRRQAAEGPKQALAAARGGEAALPDKPALLKQPLAMAATSNEPGPLKRPLVGRHQGPTLALGATVSSGEPRQAAEGGGATGQAVLKSGRFSDARSGLKPFDKATCLLTRSHDFYLSNVQSILSEKTTTHVSLRPIKVSSIFQSASLVAQEIACKLEQKKSFRQICRSIFQLLSICKYIKGIRITCSGRLNGAEIAKTECRKYGETSLHVFSDKIDYAQTRASTPYGILGVKVWISYI